MADLLHNEVPLEQCEGNKAKEELSHMMEHIVSIE